MILREINKRIIAIITLLLFLLSTSGMVLFSHYCQHADQLVYSVFIDSTQELCQENSDTLLHIHHRHHDDCCSHKSTEDNCCKNHQSDTKTIKLKNDYTFSDRQTTPKTASLSLLLSITQQQVNIIGTSLIKTGLLKELPSEMPLVLPTGRELVTLYNTLKIAC